MTLRLKVFAALLAVGLACAAWLWWVWFPDRVSRGLTAYTQRSAIDLELIAENTASLLDLRQPALIRDRLSSGLAEHPHWARLEFVAHRGETVAVGEKPAGGDVWILREPLRDSRGQSAGTLAASVDIGAWREAERLEHRRALHTFLGLLAAALGVVALLMELLVHRPMALTVRAGKRLARGEWDMPLPSPRDAQARALIGALGSLRGEIRKCHADLRAEAAERKQAQQTLRETEERYALAVRGANDGLWEWHVRTGEVYFSPRWKSILGYREDEIGASIDEWQSRVHPDDLPRALSDVEAHLNGRTPHYETEFRMRHKDGSYRWILARGTALRDARGEPTRMLGLHTDITERRHAEEVLWLVAEATAPATGEEFMRALVRNFAHALGVGYAFVTECMDYPTTRVRTLAFWVREEFASNLEYELIGTPCEEVIVGGKVCYIPSGVGQRYPKEAALGADSYLGIPIFNAAGLAVIGHLAFLDDKPIAEHLQATPIFKIFAARAGVELERKRAEQALWVEQQKLQAALGLVDDAVITTDAAGMVGILNSSAQRLTGWNVTELQGKPLQSVLEVSGGATAGVIITRDSREIPVEHRVASLRDSTGAPCGSVLLVRPVRSS